MIVNGVISTACSMLLYNNFTSFLNFLSGFIPALGAIIIADYFFVHRAEYEKPFEKKKFSAVNPIAFVSFICGISASYAMGIACVNSVAVSMISYVVLSKIAEKVKEIQTRRAAHHETMNI